MRSSDNCQYEGSEAEAFHARLYDFGPSRIDVIKAAHEGASSAISSYSDHLQYALSQMGDLVIEGNTDHTAVNVAVQNYNPTLDTLELAAATGNTVVAAVLQSKLASDFTAYEIAFGKWESDLQRASTIKTEFGTNVDSVIAEIDGLDAPVSFSSPPKPSGMSSYLHVHIGSLEHLGQQLQVLAEKANEALALLRPLVGQDDIHGAKMASAVDTLIAEWETTLTEFVNFVRNLGITGVNVADMYRTLDMESAATLEKLNQQLKALNWPTLDEDDIALVQSIIRAADQSKTPPSTKSLLPGIDVTQEETATKFNPYGVCHVGANGHLVTRGRNGEIIEVKGEKGSYIRKNPDGSQTVVSETTETTYYPVAPKNSTKSDQPLTMIRDKKTGAVSNEFIRADGSVYTQNIKNPPPVNGPAGFTPKPIDMVNSENMVAHVTNHTRADGTTTSLIYHRDTQTADVINHNGLSTMHVNPHTDEILHRGTKDYPAQGPISGRFYNLRSNEIQMHPTYMPPPESNSGWVNFGLTPKLIGDGSGGLQSVHDPESNWIMRETGIGKWGKHSEVKPLITVDVKYLNPALEIGKGVGFVNDAYSLVEGYTELHRSGNPNKFVSAAGGAVGGNIGALGGAALGTLIWPSLGTVAGAIFVGYEGGKIGEEFGRQLVSAHYGRNKDYFWNIVN